MTNNLPTRVSKSTLKRKPSFLAMKTIHQENSTQQNRYGTKTNK